MESIVYKYFVDRTLYVMGWLGNMSTVVRDGTCLGSSQRQVGRQDDDHLSLSRG